MLTEMEQKTLKYITKYIVENGRSPSHLDIANNLKITRQRVSAIIAQLSKKDVIKRKKYLPRSIKV